MFQPSLSGFARVVGILLLLAAGTIRAESRWEGLAAPDFSLQDQTGTAKTLADFRGQWLVLYFYPKDRTPGCSKEASNFRDRLADYRARKAQVIGISVDDVASHKDFSDTLKLNFPLLADDSQQTSKAYHVLFELGPVKIARRETFLINPEGIIVKHYPKVDPENHAATVLQDLRILQEPGA